MSNANRSFRIQANPSHLAAVCTLLTAEGFRFTEEPFSSCCFRLACEPFPLGASLAARFGYIYIQDRSSMLPPLALYPEQGSLVLDMCASPGSKTGFLAHLLSDGAIVANEPNPSRLATLRANLDRLGLTNCVTISLQGQNIPFPDNTFDAIQLDPPCSGWGTIEKNPKVTTIWKDSNTASLVSLQRTLLTKAAHLVKPGGTILYSTCTTNDRENEEQIVFAENSLPLTRCPLSHFPGFVYDEHGHGEGCLRINSEASKAQGFFLARLIKAGETPQKKARQEEIPPYPGFPGGRVESRNGRVFFFPYQTLPLKDHARLRGVPLGSLHAGVLTPRPGLRPFFDQGEYSRRIVLSLEEIRNLLAGKTVTTNLPAKRATLAFGDLPLALVAIKNGRILCPKDI